MKFSRTKNIKFVDIPIFGKKKQEKIWKIEKLREKKVENLGKKLSDKNDPNLAERDATLANRDATVATERALRMSAEEAAQGVTAGRSGRPIQQTGAQASVGQPVPEPYYRHQTPAALILSSQNSMRAPKFDGRSQLHLWSHKFQTFLTARGLIEALEPTSDRIRIAGGLGGMEE